MAFKLVQEPLELSEEAVADNVVIKYPWREHSNTLLSFPALDVIHRSGQDDIVGLHHFTILTACGIITGNKFNNGEVYLTHDRYGEDRVTTLRHDLLPPGFYYLQVKGSLLPRPDTSVTAGTSSGAGITNQPTPPDPYPIIPCFSDWDFPHGNVPQEWKPTSNRPLESMDRCIITAAKVTPLDNAHIIPYANKDWYDNNSMSDSLSSNVDRSVNSGYNIIRLRSDLHRLFNGGFYVFAPKPLYVNSGPRPGQSLPQQQPSTAERPEFGFAIHFLDKENVGPYIKSYHNVSPNQVDLSGRCFDFLFARFALVLFRNLRCFLQTQDNVYVSWIKVDSTTGRRSREATWKTAKQLEAHWRKNGETSKGGTKRRRTDGQNGGQAANGEVFSFEWGSQSDSDSDLELDSEGSDRGTPRQRSMEFDTESEVPPLPLPC
ncbi:hypothetical protein F4679DRAFT_587361 [Xylaria curta]|nr:hypothetical protein F4679DRAFT_587361 [Xylaria curta]